MIKLNLPTYTPRMRRTAAGTLEIYDPSRRRFLKLTPEEWVRQHFANYLISHKGYPQGLMQHEVSLSLGELKRRADTLVYDKSLQPLLLVEYKAPHIPLSEEVLEQALRYNRVFHVPYLILSNGMEHLAWQLDYKTGQATALQEIPHWQQLQSK